jgi:pseudouridine 5'-phosphatase
MDGLMVNTEEIYHEVCQTVLRKRRREFSDSLRRGMMGLPGPKALQLMIECEGLDDSIETLMAESVELFTGFLATRLQPMHGLLDLLDWMDRHRLPRCVATSSSVPLATKVLNGACLLDRVQFVITADHVTHGKPHPDIYLGAASKLGIQPEEMLVLEDSQTGCRAGVSSGACTIAVPGSHSLDHDFTGVFYIAKSLADPIITCTLAREC